MRARPQSFTVLALVAAMLLSTITATVHGQTNDQMNNWSRVTAVSPGTKLSVKLKTGKTVNGIVKSVSDSTLSLTVKNSAVDVKREDVAMVYEVVNKSSQRKRR